jgi:hypothetical protein
MYLSSVSVMALSSHSAVDYSLLTNFRATVTTRFVTRIFNGSVVVKLYFSMWRIANICNGLGHAAWTKSTNWSAMRQAKRWTREASAKPMYFSFIKIAICNYNRLQSGGRFVIEHRSVIF